MEYLIKHLGLDEMILKLGIKPNLRDSYPKTPLNEKDYEKLKQEVMKNNDLYGSENGD